MVRAAAKTNVVLAKILMDEWGVTGVDSSLDLGDFQSYGVGFGGCDKKRQMLSTQSAQSGMHGKTVA